MKGKTLALLLAISCTLTATACGASEETGSAHSRADGARQELADEFDEGKPEEEDADVEEPEIEEEPEEEEEKETKKTSAAPGELSDDLYDFQISIDGTVYQFPMWYSDFEALGWEYDGDETQVLSANQYTAVETWTKDGFEVYTKIANLSMNSAPFSESMIAGITLDDYYLKDCDWEILLPGGIQYGVSNADDIKAAYGEPDRDYDGDLYYMMTYELDYYQEIDLYVYKENDALLEIEIENMVELEGADNSVDDTVPEIVEAYEAPKSLGDDFYAYTVQIGGDVYAMPCPVSALVDNGFAIDPTYSDSEVGAGSNGWVYFKHNGQSLLVMVRNYADYATVIENCFATSIRADETNSEFDIVLPGGIKVGDSEDAVKKAAAGFDCKVDTTDLGYTYYEISDPDGSSLDGYTIIVEDGTVCTIEIYKSSEPKY